MARNIRTFVGSLPIVAKAIGRRYGVKVEIGGTKAFTDGNVIHLPALPEDDSEVELLVNGYLDHEAAHCRFTDFGVARSLRPFQSWVENALEDIRIEARMGQHYPGCRRHLGQLVDKLVRDGVETPLADDAGAPDLLSAYILRRLRFEVLGQEALDGLAEQAHERFEAMFPKGLCTKLTATMGQVREARSTQDVVDLAARIVAMLDDEAEKPQEPEASDSGDQSENQGNEGDSHRGASSDTDNTGDAASSDANARREALREAINADKGGFEKALGEQVAEQLEAQASNADGANMAEPEEAGGDSAGGGPSSLLIGEPIDQMAVRQASARLRSRLAGLIQTETLVQTARSRAGKRIDRRMLPRLRLADPRVFRSETEETGIDTAVTVLLDRSGSMRGAEIVVAREAALAVAYALEEIDGVNPSVFAFPGVGGDNTKVQCLHRRGRRVQSRRFGISAGGGTPLTEAAWFVGWELLTASEPRKILVVITDGHPNDFDSAADVLARMRASGIETLGVGINTEVHAKLISETRRIDAIGELAGALFDLLERKLVTEVAA